MEYTLQGKTLDESTNRLGISHSTAWSWRHKTMEKMKSFQEGTMFSDRSELDEKYFHKSHKGKKLSDAEPKKRGTPARKRGISGELICSLTGVSRDGAAFAEIHNMGKPSQDDVENIAPISAVGPSSGLTVPTATTGWSRRREVDRRSL